METMTLETVKNNLKEVRRANRRKISNDLQEYWDNIFSIVLMPTEAAVMRECYIKGASYDKAGYKFAYSERQIRRIVAISMDKICEHFNDKIREQ